jgi:hypothetical protein
MNRWDDPTMTTAKTDSKKRVVLPRAKPGEIYDVQEQEEGRYLLVRLERPEPKDSRGRRDCLRAMEEHPLRPGMTWDELRRMTREP